MVPFSGVIAKLRTLANFLMAQGVTMAANLLYGVLCIRLLPADDYAKFVVLFAVQGAVIAMMDVNFTATLVPLVGERVDDRKLIADYAASLRRLSLWVYAVVGAGLAAFYPFLVKHRGWSWRTVVAMIAILLVSTWFLRMGSAYGAVLILLRKRTEWYKGQLGSSLGTLVILLAFWSLHRLGPFTAILINVAGIMFVGIFYCLRARRALGVPGHVTASKQKAIVRLALPNIPQAVFWALQGQLALFLITFLGRAKGVASIGALGRLSGLFAVFIQVNSLLAEPYFAKLPKELLKKRYAVALLLSAITSTTLALVACEYPQMFLWILGPQYGNLRVEVEIAIATGAVSCFSSLLWSVHSARRFVYWWNVILNIVLIVTVQVLCAVKLDMSTVRGALLLNLGTNIASLFVNMLSGAYGFMKGPREVEDPPLVIPPSSLEAEAAIEIYALEHGETPQSALPHFVTQEVRE